MAEKKRWSFQIKAKNSPKTAANKPKIQEKHSLNPDDVDVVMQMMLMGTELCKIRSYTRRYQRKFLIDSNIHKIFYLGTQKKYCLKPQTFITFPEMHEIRRGWKTDTFNKFALKGSKRSGARYRKLSGLNFPVDEACCFSIIYGPKHKSLDLICPSEAVCKEWVRGLAFILARQKSIQREDARDKWIKRKFYKADEDCSGYLTYDECLKVLDELNIELSQDTISAIFHECNTNRTTRNGEPTLNVEEFLNFYKILDSRPELQGIFEKFSGGTFLWGPNELQSFLVEEQKMNWISLDIATSIIKRFETDQFGNDDYMTLEGFKKMMRSDEMDIFNYDHQQTIYQDMSKPLNHYYIASSHNTYLTGNQIADYSSIEGYIQALLKGCRCVELDLWDGHENEPKITHGYALTTEILLKDVLQDAIKPYAFERTDFPLILSIENHMSEEQQEVAAYYFTTILGDYLYTEKITSSMDSLPSPFHLKRKIIIRAKEGSGIDTTDGNNDLSDSDVEQAKEDETNNIKRKNVISRQISELVNICRSVKFRGFNSQLEGKFNEMASIKEDKALKLAMTSPNEFIRYTQKQLVRIYPANLRQDSSNFDPIVFWNVGCQIVALNYQTDDEYMLYNKAKFSDNGKCGYILKPEYLTSDFGDNISTDGLLQAESSRKLLTVKIISGHCLPKPYHGTSDVSDPYVEIVIKGHPSDNNAEKTKFVQNNGFNPVWDETFKFAINFWELAFVHFVVYDMNRMKDCKIGEFCVPCPSILPGYRFVHLFNKQPGSLFVHIKIDEISS